MDDGASENAIGDAGQFLWFNQFTPPAGDFPLSIDQVSVQFGSILVNVGDAIEIFIWEDADGDPNNGATLIANFSDVVQFNDDLTFSVYNLAMPAIITTVGDVYIGVVNRYGSEGFNDFPARLDQSATQGRSWVGTWLVGDAPAVPTLPADEQWGLIDDFGFPGNWMIRAQYTANIIIDPIPTMGQWGIFVLFLSLTIVSLVSIKQMKICI